MTSARFAAMKVFPSFGTKLVMSTVLGGLSGNEKSTDVLRPRNASATVRLGLMVHDYLGARYFLAYLFRKVDGGDKRNTGRLDILSISSGVFIVLSRYSKKKARPQPAEKTDDDGEQYILQFSSAVRASSGPRPGRRSSRSWSPALPRRSSPSASSEGSRKAPCSSRPRSEERCTGSTAH